MAPLVLKTELEGPQYGGGPGQKIAQIIADHPHWAAFLDKWMYFQTIRAQMGPDSPPYEPHEDQKPFHEGRERFKFVFGGARGGKSRCAAAEVGPIVATPGTRTWVVAPTYELAVACFDYIARDLEQFQKIDACPRFSRYIRNPDQGRLILEIPWELEHLTGIVRKEAMVSEVRGKSAKIGHEAGLLSVELDAVILDEAPRVKESIWSEFLRLRLRSRAGIGIIVGSPKGVNNWTVRLAKKLRDRPDYGVYGLNADNNPGNLERTIDKEELSGVAYLEQVLGRPASETGLVFAEKFDPARHVKSLTTPRRAIHVLEKWAGIDFGYRDPFAMVLLATRGKGRDMQGLVLTSYQQRGVDTSQHGRRLRPLFKEWGNFQGALCDHDGERIRMLRRQGVPARKARKGPNSWAAGVELINTLWDQDRLFIDRRCRDLVHAIPMYEYSEDEDKPKANQDDHLLDAMRMVVYTLFRKLT